MKIAVLGYTSSGKTEVLKALCGKDVENIGELIAIDHRLEYLSKLHNSKKTTPPEIILKEYKNYETQIEEIKKDDIIAIVGREFIDYSVYYAKEKISAISDIIEIYSELILKDLIHIESLLSPKNRHKRKKEEIPILEEIHNQLNSEKAIQKMQNFEEIKKIISNYQFLTAKPIIGIINYNGDIEEKDIRNRLEEYGIYPFFINAKNEREIIEIEDETERREYLKMLLNTESFAYQRFFELIKNILNLVVFYTAGEKESKAYLIESGTTAYQSAKKIHSDIQKGFIRAEVISFKDYKEFSGDKKGLKEHGKIRLEGKDYMVQDGDIILFRFNK